MEAGEDIVGSQIGDGGEGVASGKNIRQVRKSDSHNVTVKNEGGYSAWQSEMLGIAVDIKLLYNMNRELNQRLVDARGWLVTLTAAAVIKAVLLIILLLHLWR